MNQQNAAKLPAPISDADWLDLQLEPERALKEYGISLPPLPSDVIQQGFTARSGRENMQHAFAFYKYVLSMADLHGNPTGPRILDFGGGWGRIARLFLRETTPERIVIAEAMQRALDLLKDSPYTVVRSQPLPPLRTIEGERFDLIIAFSVFSHLSESHFLAWVDYLLKLLEPGKLLVFTGRGQYFIDHIRRLRGGLQYDPVMASHIRQLIEDLPPPEEIEAKYAAGEFQFYGTGGAGELTKDFFGEAFLPRQYVETHYPKNFVDFVEQLPGLAETTVVLRA